MQHNVHFKHSIGCRYYFGIQHRRQRHANGDLLPHPNFMEPRPFSLFDDAQGYAGKTPSDTLLQSAFMKAFELKEPYYHRRAQMVGGQVLGGDGSHKFVSSCFCTIMACTLCQNEYNRVIIVGINMSCLPDSEPSCSHCTGHGILMHLCI